PTSLASARAYGAVSRVSSDSSAPTAATIAPSANGSGRSDVAAPTCAPTNAASPTATYPANSLRPSARPRRAGPTRSTFMITVIDHASAWLAPSSTLARSIHHHAGAWMIRNGTGSASTQPARRI